MEKIIAYPVNKEQLKALKVFMKTLKIDFEIGKNIYDPDFIAKIETSRQEIKTGKGKKIKVEDLWK